MRVLIRMLDECSDLHVMYTLLTSVELYTLVLVASKGSIAFFSCLKAWMELCTCAYSHDDRRLVFGQCSILE